MVRSLIPALIFALITAAWVGSGQLGRWFEGFEDIQAEPEITKPAAELDETKSLQRVSTVTISQRDFTSALTFTGETAVDRKIEVKAEIDGQIAEIFVERGDRVKRGDVIATLDPDDRPAVVAEAKAALSQAEIDFRAKKSLADKGFGSSIDVEVAQASVERAKASLLKAELALENLQVTAPFDGTIENKFVEPGSFVSGGQSIVLLLDKSRLRVNGLAGERQISRVAPGQTGTVTLATGDKIQARVSYISSLAEGDTRTFRVELLADNPNGRIPEGVSADVSLPLDAIKAHFVPASVLTLNASDQIGVKVLMEDQTVGFYAGNIISASSRGMWLGGLPQDFTLIVQGQDLVIEGQEVDALKAEIDDLRRLNLETQG